MICCYDVRNCIVAQVAWPYRELNTSKERISTSGQVLETIFDLCCSLTLHRHCSKLMLRRSSAILSDIMTAANGQFI